MNATILSKPVAVAVLAGCVATFGIGMQFALLGDNEAAAQRMVLDQGTGRESRGRSAPRGDTATLDTIKVPAVMMAAPSSQGGVGVEFYDRKPRAASEVAIERALQSQMRSSGLQYEDVALEQVVAEIAQEYNILIQIDRVALEDAGLKPTEPVTVRIGGISLRAGLRQMLRPIDLTYIVRDEVMLITTPVVAEEDLETRVYPADGSQTKDNIDALKNMIVRHIETDTWAESGGGTAEITAFSGGLVVTQTFEAHEQVCDLLKQFGWPAVKQE
jgi:hypothetical protein